MPDTLYPPGAPTIAGNVISVDAFLNNPPLVQRAIMDLTLQRFLADRIFAAGPPTNAGSVLYEQVAAGEWFTVRDVQEIEPGDEFPIVDGAVTPPLVAIIKKWGGAFLVTDEARQRNRRDIVARNLVKLRNTVTRKVDTVAMATLNAAPIVTQAASGDWTVAATDVIADLETARSTIDQADLGYEADTVIIHPSQALDVRKDADLRTALPRESVERNLLSAPDLSGLLGFPNWYVTNRQTAGTIHVLASGQVGGISEEKPLTSEVIPERKNERTRVQASRRAVPYVTDPLAVVKITGA